MKVQNGNIRLLRTGLILGTVFPVIAISADIIWQRLPLSWPTISSLFANGPLQWIILSAPLVLGFVFRYFERIVTVREEKLRKDQHKNQEEVKKLESFISDIDKENLTENKYQFENTHLLELLSSLKTKLTHQKREDEISKWVTGGLARFGEIFRSTTDLAKLSEEILKNLVRYAELNQGAVFILKIENNNEKLDLMACYAYDRKKYLTKAIDPGEGLAGQCYLENETIVLRKVPQEYVRITSGLGEATPGYVVIIPIKANDKTEGVMELAGFVPLPDYKVKFLEKVCEGYASVIRSIKINDETKALLDASQLQAEQLRAQEEEMRQNMEELHTTQEQMERKSKETNEQVEELKSQEEELRQNMEELQAMQEQMTLQLEESKTLKDRVERREQIMTLTTILSETDLKGVITYVNDKFCEVAKYKREELVGMPHNIVRHPDMPKDLFRIFWKTIQSGEVFKGIVKNKAKDGTAYWVDATIVPLKDAEGKIYKYVGARYHLTDEELALKLYNKQTEHFKWPKL